MTIYDIVVSVFLCYHLITGFRAGAFKIIGKTIALFICFSIARDHYLIVGPTLSTIFNIHPKIENIIYFATTFCIIYITSLVILHLIFKMMKLVTDGIFDNIFGAILGLIKGSLMVIAITIPLIMFNVSWVENSLIISESRPFIDMLITWMEGNSYFNHVLKVLNISTK